MSAIFISHSSKDNAWAERIAAWLREQGYESQFLDFDPQNGIPAGRDWNKELHHQLRRCRAVIALLSEHFAASDWCKGEVWIASNLGKSLLPVRVGPCELPQMLRSFQAIDLTIDPDDGFQRLARGLAEAGLDPKDIFQWDQKRPPYPGLMAFQEKDAPVFFGRGEAIQEGLDRLHNLRRYGGKALLLVLGASGCGKSSLVRAGIVPRLRRDPENWLVLDPFRPGLDPCAELADVLSKAFAAHGLTSPDAPPVTAKDLQRDLERLRRSSGQREATVVIPIDQFEELLGDGDGADAGVCQGIERFLSFLCEAVRDTSSLLVVLATLRSDFLGAFQNRPALLGLTVDQFLVGPMEVDCYTQVIEGPAQVAGLELETGLTQRLVADTQTGDALPLLAFTLRELWERYGRDGDLTLSEYGALGGLEGSVQRAADGVIQARALRPEETQAVRKAFLTMTRINDQGQYARIPARWEAMLSETQEVLQRFVEARLLVSGKESGTIEVAHEALLRTWPLLKGWLEGSREFLLWRSRFQAALAEHGRSGTLLTGKPLTEAERWREATAVDSAERKLIEASLVARRRQRRRNRLLAAVGGLAVAAFTGGLWWQLRSIREWQTQVFIGAHRRLIESDPQASVVNGLAAMGRSMGGDPGLSIALSESLSRAMENNFEAGRSIPISQSAISTMLVLKSGNLLIGFKDGTLQRWKDGKRTGELISTGQGEIVRLTELDNGDIASVGKREIQIETDNPRIGGAFAPPGVDGKKRLVDIGQTSLRYWRDGKPARKEVHTGDGLLVKDLFALRNGDTFIVGNNVLLRGRYKEGFINKVNITEYGSWFRNLLELKNGDLLILLDNGKILKLTRAGEVREFRSSSVQKHAPFRAVELKNGDIVSMEINGTVKRWRNGTELGQIVDTKEDVIDQLLEIYNGDFVASGSNGSLQLIRHNKLASKKIQTGQGAVRLVQLKSGEIISGGEDGSLRMWNFKAHNDMQLLPASSLYRRIIKLRDSDLIIADSVGNLHKLQNGKPVGAIIPTGISPLVSLIELESGDLIAGNVDGILQRWRKGRLFGEKIETDQRPSHSLIEAEQGLLVSAGTDGTLRWWRNGKAIGPSIDTGQDAIWGLASTKNGVVISGGTDGSIRYWKDRKALGPPLDTGRAPVISLRELRNGDLISSIGDGTVRRWRNGKLIGSPIYTSQGYVSSIVELNNGELILGGSDGSLRRLVNRRLIDEKIQAGHDEGLLSLNTYRAKGLVSLIGVTSKGKLIHYSPLRIAKSICLEELPYLMRYPQTLAEKEASSVCRRLGFI